MKNILEMDLEGNFLNNKAFYNCIEDLLELEEVKALSGFTHHRSVTRLDHCMNVAYFSYYWCKRLNLDYRSAARGALLHDLFHYEWQEENMNFMEHGLKHSRIALENARKVCKLNKIEEDSILKHMWPLNIMFPKYKESYIVSLGDKYCAVYEGTGREIPLLSK